MPAAPLCASYMNFPQSSSYPIYASCPAIYPISLQLPCRGSGPLRMNTAFPVCTAHAARIVRRPASQRCCDAAFCFVRSFGMLGLLCAYLHEVQYTPLLCRRRQTSSYDTLSVLEEKDDSSPIRIRQHSTLYL